MADKTAKKSWDVKRFFKDQRTLLAIVIVAIVLIVSLINPKFIMVSNIITIFQQISVLGILTMAMSMLLISGGIDLSIGNIMVVSGVVMSVLIGSGVPTFVALLAGLLVGTVCGLINGVIIAKSKCIPLIITLGTSQAFYGIALSVSGGSIMSFKGAFNGLKAKIADIFPVMLLVLLFMTAVAYVLMNYTKFGRRIVAIGGNEKNAFLSGISVTKYKIIIYGIAGLFCAVASIVFCARIDSITSNAGSGYETDALTAAIIGGVTFDGGKGTIGGAFLGCLLMGVIKNAMNILLVPTYIQTIVTGCIIVAAVVLSNINNIRKK
ncbi:MAG: ABC transporter permease [Oscillospiraceae bacterium]|nr:ABC transporter permease [Oscillospiraceae bacterium]